MPFVIVGAIVAIVEFLLLLRTPFAGEVFLPLMSGGIAGVLLLACRNAARTLRGVHRKRAPGIEDDRKAICVVGTLQRAGGPAPAVGSGTPCALSDYAVHVAADRYGPPVFRGSSLPGCVVDAGTYRVRLRGSPQRRGTRSETFTDDAALQRVAALMLATVHGERPADETTCRWALADYAESYARDPGAAIATLAAQLAAERAEVTETRYDDGAPVIANGTYDAREGVLDLGTDRKDPNRGLEAGSRESIVSPQVAGAVLVPCVCALIFLIPHVVLVPPLARCAGPRPAGAIKLDLNQAINASRQHDGGPPLLARAVDAGDTRSACVLLELGVTGDAITPVLARAARHDDVAMTRLLLSKGVPLDARDPQGHTALMTAAENGKVRVASVLLAAGADTRVRNVAGETATDIAVRSGATGVAQAIRAAEAKRK